MPTKKQARAQLKRRQAQFEAKLAARRAHRRRRHQVTGAVAVGALVLGGGTLAAFSLSSNGTSPGLTSPNPPSPNPSATGPPSLFPSGYSEGREWTATLNTSQGTLILNLDGEAAPLAVSSFASIANQGLFDGTSCHRLTTDDLDPATNDIFILQCGSLTGTGSDGPGYSFGPIENAPADDLYPAGTVAMARVGDDEYSMGSQFFIVYRDSYIPSDAAGGYSVFGAVTEGLDIVEAIAEAGTETGSPFGPPAMSVVLNEVTAV